MDGLQVTDGDVDGLAGTIQFPTVGAAPGVLREDLQLPLLGLPRDLSGDGLVDAADHASDYRLLPVLVRVEWQGASGASTCEFKTLLGDF